MAEQRRALGGMVAAALLAACSGAVETPTPSGAPPTPEGTDTPGEGTPSGRTPGLTTPTDTTRPPGQTPTAGGATPSHRPGETPIGPDETPTGPDHSPTQTAPPVPNRAPTATILSPPSGATFEVGEAVPLVGLGEDPEEGALSGGSLTWSSSIDGLLGTGSPLTAAHLSEGAHTLTLTALDGEGLAGRDRVAVTLVAVGTDQPPLVTISAPADGAILTAGAPVHLAGQAIDPEDGALGASALSWASSLDGALGQGGSLDVSLSQGQHTLTLSARDSFGNPGAAAVEVTVNSADHAPPTVRILAPADGAEVEVGQAVSFSGEGEDADGAPLEGDALSWRSSLDGPLGVGEALSVSDLSVGGHRIVLTGTDTFGGQATDAVDLWIFAASENAPPTAEILEPQDGASFARGEIITLRGRGEDPEDGTLTGTSLRWSSSLDGALGAGATLSVGALSAGQHTVTLTAFDHEAALGKDQIALTVTPGEPVNLPPTCRLSGPLQSQERSVETFDGAGSTDADGAVVGYTFSVDGALVQEGSSPSFTTPFEAPGEVEIGLTCTDDDGATGSASLTVTVSPFVRQPRTALDSADSLASACSLAFTPGDRAVVGFYDATHPQLGVALEGEGGAYSVEIIDGKGLDVGGQVDDALAVAVSDDGAVHGAWLLQVDGAWRLRYGRRAPEGGWSVADLGLAAQVAGLPSVSLALTPGGAPRILYRAAEDRATLASCDAACASAPSWSAEDVFVETRSQGYPSYAWPVDLAIAPDGAISALVSYHWRTGSSTYQRGLLYLRRAPGGPWGPSEAPTPPASTSSATVVYARLTVDDGGEPFVLLANGITHPVDGVWQLSPAEEAAVSSFDLTFTPALGSPSLAYRHSQLELVRLTPQGYFTYEQLGAVDNAWPSMAADRRGEARVCFIRSGNLLVY